MSSNDENGPTVICYSCGKCRWSRRGGESPQLSGVWLEVVGIHEAHDQGMAMMVGMIPFSSVTLMVSCGQIS